MFAWLAAPPPASASAKPAPVATMTSDTVAGNASVAAATAVAYRSLPANRTTVPLRAKAANWDWTPVETTEVPPRT